MFKAIVVACSIINPNYCVVLQNAQYPVIYETYEECKVRALKMAGDVHIYMKKFKPTRWKCEKIQEGRLL